MPHFPKVGCIVKDIAATGTQSAFGPVQTGEKGFQACVSGTGAVTATVLVEASTEASGGVMGWFTLGTITLSGTTTTNDAFATNSNWPYLRGNITAISGTGARVTLNVAEER